MSTIETALGSIDSAELGFTLSHEHVSIGLASSPHLTEFFDRKGTANRVALDLTEAKVGGQTTGDGPHLNLRDLSLKVIASGFW